MPSEPSSSQSISISGSNLTDSPIAQAQGHINQSLQVGSDNSAKQLQSSDIIALLDQLKALLESSNLTGEQKEKAVLGVATAKNEATEEEPDKDFAGKGLGRTIQTLKQANEALTEGSSLWDKAEPILRKVLPWFGLALSILA
jgi:hypothetical protein